jgi:ATP-dependent exoDNAse (exonuclease V) beta subunit
LWKWVNRTTNDTALTVTCPDCRALIHAATSEQLKQLYNHVKKFRSKQAKQRAREAEAARVALVQEEKEQKKVAAAALAVELATHNVWMQEVFLYSDKLKTAGQVDCIAEYDGVLSIIDFKTSRKPKKEEWIEGYFMQACFYAAAFLERTGIPIKQAVILIAVDGHESQVFKINTFDYLEHFLSVRKKYKEINGI